MANSDKNIVIRPSIGSTIDQPSITFTGAGNTSITLKVLDDAEGTLSFEGYQGQVFAVNTNLSSGIIYSVNDISGLPLIDANADGTIRLGIYTGNIGIGVTNPSQKFQIGAANTLGISTDGQIFVITSNEDVGIGTTRPTSKLHVVGNSLLGNFRITSVGTGATVGGIGVTYFGDGSQLTGIAGGVSISTNTTNSNQYIPYATSFGSTTGLGATTLLVYNPSTTRLGIGTTNPTQTLQVGTGSSIVIIDSIGDVGIGTTNATSKLYVSGDGFFSGVVTTGGLSAVSAGTTIFSVGIATTATSIFTVTDFIDSTLLDVRVDGNVILTPNYGSVGVGTTRPLQKLQIGTANTLGISTDNSVFVVTSVGSVGVGTTNPTSKLHVIGGALITGVSTVGNFRMTPVGTGATVGGIGVTYFGDGSQLSNIVTGVSISTNTTNSNQYISYATSFGSTTGFGATTLLVYNPSTTRLGIGTTNPLHPLQVGTGSSIVIVDSLGDVGIGTTNATSKLHVIGGALITGVSTVGNFRMTPVGTGATVGGIGVTYYGDGSQLTNIASNGEFFTGVSSSVQVRPLSYETTMFTFPSTSGKQYVIESINVANVDTSVGVGTTVNIIASIQDSTAEQTYIAYNVPIVNGGLIELLKNPMVAGPSDVIKMWATNGNYVGVNTALEVYMNYTEYTSTAYTREYASTVSIASTDLTTVYTSTTYPSVIESIHLANRTDTGDYPVSVTITNGATTTYLARDLLIPRYSTVDILDRPKRVELNGTIGIKVGQTSTIDVIIAGKQIV